MNTLKAFVSRIWTSVARVLARLMARCVEIESPIVVLLTIRRAGTPIMKLNGKSWMGEVNEEHLQNPDVVCVVGRGILCPLGVSMYGLCVT